ncbi:hypothetical protein ACIQC5_13600 [Paenarthrobacter sp. NPDC092416]|uniref:hypothetical protein n=1 Tax=Paenarthrobacter sp. NPDC092416 TaxID=3364386 RepID=UPI00381F8E95
MPKTLLASLALASAMGLTLVACGQPAGPGSGAAQTRTDPEDLLLDIHAKLGVTVLVVTHDIDESIYLADHVIALSAPPSTVAETVEVDLPRPRDQITTKQDPRFVELRAHVTSLLRSH